MLFLPTLTFLLFSSSDFDALRNTVLNTAVVHIPISLAAFWLWNEIVQRITAAQAGQTPLAATQISGGHHDPV
ncbi:MAG: hypothetical protein DI498_05795 [Paracoccus denitrificans]|nr:MAG: hypothetical protein DI498_05795 [Paracoccus denitrificans]PZO84941.1 MAG: hypothetical protein DI633_05795 [Paracoccus denitrificans]